METAPFSTPTMPIALKMTLFLSILIESFKRSSLYRNAQHNINCGKGFVEKVSASYQKTTRNRVHREIDSTKSVAYAINFTEYFK
ncbi:MULTISPECIES: hypothetical protein [Vibrio]|uniref:hypothetical protein n=1 Tax=Vibrio TaxID=662 RepID=UPI00128B070B|nr:MULTISPECIES: hypothetical protein [Vibrio]MPW36976.1 hypothetical protein [Vibrio sp. B1Z05]